MSDDDTGSRELLADRVAAHGDRLAVVDADGEHTFATLHDDAVRVATALLAGRSSLGGERVGVLCRPGRDVLGALLGCWLADGLAVPLHPDHPVPELRYALDTAGATVLLHSTQHAGFAAALADEVEGLTVAPVEDARTIGGSEVAALPEVDVAGPALMVFTSGTTGRPKGAVHTHAGLAAGITEMVEAWEWSAGDRTLLVLPLNHVHGLVNVTLTALWVGAVCEAPGRFDAAGTWERFASGDVTVFMAVPTIYSRLVAAWDAAEEGTRRRWSDGAGSLRLMVSGSAALPVATLDRWEALTGQRLLERYGMTELGMVLTNSIDRRVPGHVGEPLPGVEVRLVDEAGAEVTDGGPGELWVRGPQIFSGYWERPEATAEVVVDGWFHTGDIAVHTDDGYRLLGRASVDIIKSGGEKVSALEIEEVFRTHPAIADCAVVGVPDPEWGQRVALALVPSGAADVPTGDELRSWGRERLAAPKVPSRWATVDDLPRNALGKVTKRDLVALFEAPSG